MAEIEKEAKLVVSSQDYHRLMETGTLLGCRDQLNIYFHDPERLGQGLGYFRVRFQTGREPVATLKIPKIWVGAVREMVEIQRPLSEMGPGLRPRPGRTIRVAEDLPGQMGRHFSALGITRLRRLGWMRNRRCEIQLGGIGTVELDRTLLPGGRVHHEVEIETSDEDLLRRLMEKVREGAPSAVPSSVGKFSRFLEAMDGLPQSRARS